MNNPDPAPGGNRRPVVLLAEDDDGVRSLLEAALDNAGFGVLAAEDGEAAVELFRRHQSNVAAVLLDVRMPRLDGPSTLAALRGIAPSVRCCFISGHTGEYGQALLRSLGAACVLEKPFRLDVLTDTLRKLVREPGE